MNQLESLSNEVNNLIHDRETAIKKYNQQQELVEALRVALAKRCDKENILISDAITLYSATPRKKISNLSSHSPDSLSSPTSTIFSYSPSSPFQSTQYPPSDVHTFSPEAKITRNLYTHGLKSDEKENLTTVTGKNFYGKMKSSEDSSLNIQRQLNEEVKVLKHTPHFLQKAKNQ